MNTTQIRVHKPKELKNVRSSVLAYKDFMSTRLGAELDQVPSKHYKKFLLKCIEDDITDLLHNANEY